MGVCPGGIQRGLSSRRLQCNLFPPPPRRRPLHQNASMELTRARSGMRGPRRACAWCVQERRSHESAPPATGSTWRCSPALVPCPRSQRYVFERGPELRAGSLRFPIRKTLEMKLSGWLQGGGRRPGAGLHGVGVWSGGREDLRESGPFHLLRCPVALWQAGWLACLPACLLHTILLGAKDS